MVTGQQLLDRFNTGRFREQVSLAEFAAKLLQHSHLFFLFNSFGNNFQPKVMGKRDDDADDFVSFRVAIHAGDEGAVNL